MNSIHFVIKRLANIRKYFKQKGFLGKIALTDTLCPSLFPASLHRYLAFAKLVLQKEKKTLCQLPFIK